MIQPTLYNKTVVVKRLTASGDLESYATNIEALACNIQPLDETTTEDLDGNFGKDWLMFCDQADILEGDRVVDGAIEYKVVGVENFDSFLGQPRHLEVRIRHSNT